MEHTYNVLVILVLGRQRQVMPQIKWNIVYPLRGSDTWCNTDEPCRHVLDERHQSQRGYTMFFHSCEVPRVVEFVAMESRPEWKKGEQEVTV